MRWMRGNEPSDQRDRCVLQRGMTKVANPHGDVRTAVQGDHDTIESEEPIAVILAQKFVETS